MTRDLPGLWPLLQFLLLIRTEYVAGDHLSPEYQEAFAAALRAYLKDVATSRNVGPLRKLVVDWMPSQKVQAARAQPPMGMAVVVRGVFRALLENLVHELVSDAIIKQKWDAEAPALVCAEALDYFWQWQTDLVNRAADTVGEWPLAEFSALRQDRAATDLDPVSLKKNAGRASSASVDQRDLDRNVDAANVVVQREFRDGVVASAPADVVCAVVKLATAEAAAAKAAAAEATRFAGLLLLSSPVTGAGDAAIAAQEQQRRELATACAANPSAVGPELATTSATNSATKTRLSRLLCAVLRHRAPKMGLPMGSDGYVPLGLILGHKQFKQCSREDVLGVVATNAKKRFSMYVLRKVRRTSHTADSASEPRARIVSSPACRWRGSPVTDSYLPY